ncbi:hypothetical protein N6H18_00130 [Reichenbachiella agarivorans]|uniref:Uncharacterized protein n=1 Tax=Reichenbachiella agarivorans TaxID=2979464 RepID=A0ABY6CPG8_9BACT|nr:hypothetical protein [Reichenbachiella agarivorans]UXP32382.1 hypothetical protein N6H18_00130 [Reichenbachiella agarivorans]
MKKKINYIVAILFSMLALAACNEEDGKESLVINIDQYPVDFAPVNLDEEINPVTGNVSSDTKLVKVSFYVVSGEGDAPFQEVTTFEGKGTSYDYSVIPPYSITTSFVKITAENEAGDVAEVTRKVLMTGGPDLTLDMSEFVIDLSVESTDTITGIVESAGGILTKVDYLITKDGTETQYKSVALSGEQKTEYTMFEIITFELGMSSIHVVATDDKGNVTSSKIKVSVVASPVFLYYEYTGKELHGTDKRKTAGNGIGISLIDGSVYDMATITADPDGKGIDFMITNADNEADNVRYYSPSGQNGDKFKLNEINGDLNLNITTFSVLDRGDEAFFDAATKEDILAMTLTDEGASTRNTDLRGIAEGVSNVDILGGKVVYFETAWGAQCLVRLTEVKQNPASSTKKGDYYVMDFKVVYQQL